MYCGIINALDYSFLPLSLLLYFQYYVNCLLDQGWIVMSHYSNPLTETSFCFSLVPMGSPLRGGNVVAYVKDRNHPSLPTPFYSVHVSIFVFLTFSTVLHSINYQNSPPLSHSVLPVLILPYWSFQLTISL